MSYRICLTGAATLLLVIASGAGSAPRAAAPDVGLAAAGPSAFEPNLGQFDARVRFASRGRGYTLFLTDREAVVALRSGPGSGTDRPRSPSVLRLSLDDANTHPAVGLERRPGVVNYLLGNDPGAWRTNVPLYARVHYADVYRGVDLVYYGRDGGHEYDFVVAPLPLDRRRNALGGFPDDPQRDSAEPARQDRRIHRPDRTVAEGTGQ